MLRLPDALIWDSWLADDGRLYHLFFLMAPRAGEHPSGRHLRAAIVHATSTDLTDRPFGHLEVPQVRLVDGRPLLAFTCHPDDQEEEWRRGLGAFSTWTVAGQSMTGPWDLTQARPFREEPALFAACEIIDPIRVQLDVGGLVALLQQGAAQSSGVWRDAGDDGG